MVAKGFHQRLGFEYHETFSLVVKPTTIRTVLSISLVRGWPIRQLEVNNAFLHDILSEDVFMQQPSSFIDITHPSHVYKLHKSVYDLKLSSCTWYNELKVFLLSFRLVNSRADPSLSVYNAQGSQHIFWYMSMIYLLQEIMVPSLSHFYILFL